MKSSLLAVSLVALLSPALALALAEDDCEGCKDHPQMARFPGYFLESVEQNDFNSVEFQLGDEKAVTKEGRFWSIQHQLKEGAKTPSAVEVVRNYEAAFKKAGGKLEWRGSSWESATLSLPLGKSQRWMAISIMKVG